MDLANGKIKDLTMRKCLVFLAISLLVVVALYVIDIRLWQAARDMVEPNFLFILEWFSHWGLYLFYAADAAVFLYGLIKKITTS